MTTVVQRSGGQSNELKVTDAKSNKGEDVYDVFGTEDIYVARAAVVAVAPVADDDGNVLDSVKMKHIEVDIWEATVSYVAPEKQKKEPDIGEIEWDYDDTGGTQHITQGLKPSKAYPVPGWNKVEFQRAIGVSKTKTGWQVKGTDIVVPKGAVTATTSFAPGTVTTQWRQAIKKLVGRVNDAAFHDWEKGELKFLGMRVKTKTREKETCAFSFLEASNITVADNLRLGGDDQGNGATDPIEMTGHQHIWSYFVQEEDNNQVLMKLKQVNIETVCMEGNFADLGLGG